MSLMAPNLVELCDAIREMKNRDRSPLEQRIYDLLRIVELERNKASTEI